MDWLSIMWRYGIEEVGFGIAGGDVVVCGGLNIG